MTFDLVERLEQAVCGGPVHADAGVDNIEYNPCLLPRLRHTAAAKAHRDAPPFGKFDRIADKVQQDLLEPLRVTDYAVLHVRVNIEREPQALAFGIRPKQGDNRQRHRMQRHRSKLQTELACFDLRMVEHVIQNGHQRNARRRRGAHEAALIHVELRTAQQLQRAEHAVHRSPNLMAHRGQELRLCHVGRLGGLLGPLQQQIRCVCIQAVLDRAGGGGLELPRGAVHRDPEHTGQRRQGPRLHGLARQADPHQRTQLQPRKDRKGASHQRHEKRRDRDRSKHHADVGRGSRAAEPRIDEQGGRCPHQAGKRRVAFEFASQAIQQD